MSTSDTKTDIQKLACVYFILGGLGALRDDAPEEVKQWHAELTNLSLKVRQLHKEQEDFVYNSLTEEDKAKYVWDNTYCRYRDVTFDEPINDETTDL
jgi:hypothetical protein